MISWLPHGEHPKLCSIFKNRLSTPGLQAASGLPGLMPGLLTACQIRMAALNKAIELRSQWGARVQVKRSSGLL